MSHNRTVLLAAVYKTVPVEFNAMSLMFVSPFGHVNCRVEELVLVGPSLHKPDDLKIEKHYNNVIVYPCKL